MAALVNSARRRGAVPQIRLILMMAGLMLSALLASMSAVAQPMTMDSDKEYRAFMQNLQEARNVAYGPEGAAIADALRKRGI